jgi:ElaB/YqjD/DUF883 family membrane-anchored ribosome-binding protein
VTTTVLEKTSDRIAETVEEVNRATSKAGEALQDEFETARLFAKRGARAAEELFDETKLQIKKRPISTIAATLFVGMAAGTLVGWMMWRK